MDSLKRLAAPLTSDVNMIDLPQTAAPPPKQLLRRKAPMSTLSSHRDIRLSIVLAVTIERRLLVLLMTSSETWHTYLISGAVAGSDQDS